MSKENAARLIKAIGETPDLNKKAAAEPSTDAWVKLGKAQGLDFSSQDFVDLVKEVTGKAADKNNAVSLLLQGGSEMSDQQLDQVAGGVLSLSTISFSPTLYTSLSSYNLGGIANSFVKTSGPSFVKS
jgi:predicted ribosomally synthesized peptide with nif11-like leader